MTEPRLALSRDGRMIHRADCRHARVPWQWADSRHPCVIWYEAVWLGGARIAKCCTPIKWVGQTSVSTNG